jgi:hypothetical protein
MGERSIGWRWVLASAALMWMAACSPSEPAACSSTGQSCEAQSCCGGYCCLVRYDGGRGGYTCSEAPREDGMCWREWHE